MGGKEVMGVRVQYAVGCVVGAMVTMVLFEHLVHPSTGLAALAGVIIGCSWGVFAFWSARVDAGQPS